MTEFNDKVERQRLLLAAEEMRDNVTNIHTGGLARYAHSST